MDHIKLQPRSISQRKQIKLDPYGTHIFFCGSNKKLFKQLVLIILLYMPSCCQGLESKTKVIAAKMVEHIYERL